jgi:hypothetical protein
VSGRGGKRAGAGRRGYGLTPLQRFLVGAEVARFMQDAWEKAFAEYRQSDKAGDIEEERLEHKTSDSAVEDERLEHNEQGDLILTEEEQERRCEHFADYMNFWDGDMNSTSVLQDVEQAIENLGHPVEGDPRPSTRRYSYPRLVTIPRPQVKAQALAHAVAWCKEQYGVEIDSAAAAEWFKEYRRALNSP